MRVVKKSKLISLLLSGNPNDLKIAELLIKAKPKEELYKVCEELKKKSIIQLYAFSNEIMDEYYRILDLLYDKCDY